MRARTGARVSTGASLPKHGRARLRLWADNQAARAGLVLFAREMRIYTYYIIYNIGGGGGNRHVSMIGFRTAGGLAADRITNLICI